MAPQTALVEQTASSAYVQGATYGTVSPSTTHIAGATYAAVGGSAAQSVAIPASHPLQTGLDRGWAVIKRTIDLVAAASVLVLTAPLFAAIAIAIKLDSQGPVFYRVRRMGHRGEMFMMLKFRKMYDDAAPFPLTGAADERLTRVGARLTRSRLDELPQLWDVVRGRMSLIGPRPEDPQFVALSSAEYEEILSVRPGITGISQIAFKDESTILDPADPIGDYVTRIMPHKVKLDLLYVRENRARMDLAVVFWTALALLTGRQVAVHRTDGRMNLRRRPTAQDQQTARTERV